MRAHAEDECHGAAWSDAKRDGGSSRLDPDAATEARWAERRQARALHSRGPSDGRGGLSGPLLLTTAAIDPGREVGLGSDGCFLGRPVTAAVASIG